MPNLLIRQHVADFDKWKPSFDEQAPARREAGSKGGWLFRGAGDPNEVVVLLEWDDPDKAAEFAGSDEVWQALGHPVTPEGAAIALLEEAGEPAA